MTKIAQITVSKALVAFVAAAMLFTMFAAPAKAATTVEGLEAIEGLEAMINTLKAQIAALQGNTNISGGNCAAIPAPLTIGAQNSYVTNLQNYLLAAGQSIPAGATGYFGTQTQSALAAWQAANGVSPAVGYYGPITAAAMAAKCVPVDTDGDNNNDTTSADLKGGAGAVEDTDIVSGLSNEEVGEGAEDVKVAGLEVEMDDGSDVEIVAVRLTFSDEGTTNNDDDLDEYVDEVSILFNGEEVARVDADEFNDDNTYTKTVALDSGAIIRADETGELTVAISALNNIDDASLDGGGDSWDVDFVSIRFRDAQDAIITETVTESAVVFKFVDFASAADLELKISEADEDINDSRVIDVDDSDDTDAVELMSFEFEVEGDSDVLIDDLSISATSSGASVSEIVNSLELVVNGEVIGSETVPTDASDEGIAVLFDNLNWTLEAGETVEVIVRGDINDLDGDFGAGDTLLLSFGETETDLSTFDAEDEDGEDLVDADKTGTVTTEAHVFYDNGISVALTDTTVSEVAGDSADDDYVTLSIKFDVTAFGEDIYLDNTVSEAGTSTSGTAFGVDLSDAEGTYIAAASTTFAFADEDATSGTNGYKINEGTTEGFTLTVTVSNAATSTFDAKYVRAVLTGLGFNTDDSTTFSTFTSRLSSDFKTDYGFISN